MSTAGKIEGGDTKHAPTPDTSTTTASAITDFVQSLYQGLSQYKSDMKQDGGPGSCCDNTGGNAAPSDATTAAAQATDTTTRGGKTSGPVVIDEYEPPYQDPREGPAKPLNRPDGSGPSETRPENTGRPPGPDSPKPIPTETNPGPRPTDGGKNLPSDNDKPTEGTDAKILTKPDLVHHPKSSSRHIGAKAEAPTAEEQQAAMDVLSNPDVTSLIGLSDTTKQAAEALVEHGVEGLQDVLKQLETDPNGEQKLRDLAKELGNMLGTEMEGKVGSDGKFSLEVLTQFSDSRDGCFPAGTSETRLNIPSSGDPAARSTRYWDKAFPRAGEPTDGATESLRLQQMATREISGLPQFLNDAGAMEDARGITREGGISLTPGETKNVANDGAGMIRAGGPDKAMPPKQDSGRNTDAAIQARIQTLTDRALKDVLARLQEQK